MLDHEAICDLIPHAEGMCLLDRVINWTESSITCLTESHLSADNPLNGKDEFSSVMLIEYGAQAMAVHGGLKAKQQQEVLTGGYLAALRNISLANQDIRKINEPLRIEAEQLMVSAGSMIYEFSVCIDSNNEPLASGRATVIEIVNKE